MTAAQHRHIHVYEGPAFTHPDQVHSTRYGREPSVRVQLPGRESFDAIMTRWSEHHLLVCWQETPGGPIQQAWVPTRWASPLDASQARWRPGAGRDPLPWRDH
ncbi:hypothetical protein [Micrococcus sp.]|uniref:hypothetical protein n=1 Tax=Micrococcus sp. TaxID=1271 RepID=UPI0026DB1B8A|nr:hypothetical protein [Micrococcus sp.]MDO4240822.1 hypothetical protein [Micrococcus sp.]